MRGARTASSAAMLCSTAVKHRAREGRRDVAGKEAHLGRARGGAVVEGGLGEDLGLTAMQGKAAARRRDDRRRRGLPEA